MPSETTLQIRTYTADFLVIGGGAAGCYAALAYCGCLDADGCHPGPDGHGLTAHEGAAAVADAADATAPAMSCTAPLARHNAATHDGSDVPAAPAVHDGAPATGADGGSMGVPARPWHHAPVLIAEKAHIRRSGCLAAGVNALNAYIAPGRTPQDYVDYARADAGGIVRGDLLLSMAQRLNQVTDRLEELGLAILKNEDGSYAIRGDRNLKINGENLKPLLHDGVAKEKRIETLNHVNVFEYIVLSGRVAGAYAFSVREPILYVLLARSVLCATGGAAGLYAPNHTGFSRHKMWYPPFNTGAGYAMGIRAGAEMTTLEMRFIALRCKDTIAPTGTLAQGIGARQVNRKGEIYEDRYERTTAGRLHGTVCENREGRGPCRLGTAGITPEQEEDLVKAYLNMAPSQSLRWLETDAGPGSADVEIEGTEPYIVGGHTASGYWVDTYRETTLPGLFAAGDAAGGCPQKYVTGAMAEGEIAAKRAAGKYGDAPIMTPSAGEIAEHKEYLENTLRPCGRGVAAHHPVEHPSDTTPCPSPLAKIQHTTSGSAPEGSSPQAGLDSAPGTTSSSGIAPEGR
ncbi:MAG: adenylyl-sulfate reductase subunit alpha, partial [Lachnospiraceae bacterium]|nr:adenylyl-sulfate reductase subunit alpha [Lachnospiraceae bacterium]